MMNEILSMTPPQHSSRLMKVPWFTFLFFTVVFFAAQHEWFISLKKDELFGTTIDELTMLIKKGNVLRQMMFTSLGIFGMTSLVWRGEYRLKIKGLLGWLSILFMSWAFLSLTWSENPAITLKRLVILAMLGLGALAVSQRFEPRDLVLWVFVSTFIYLHVGLAAEVLLGTFHPFAAGDRFAGTIHPNIQGVNCTLLFIASLFLLKSGRRWHRIFVATALEALVFLFFTRSRTSLAFGIIAIFLYWVLRLPLSRKGAVALCLAWISCLLILLGDFIFPFLQRAIMLGRTDSEMLTLNSRIPIWGQILTYIFEHPIQGYGYDCFWTPKHIAEITNQQILALGHAHSAYLDLSLGLGLVGGITYILLIIIGIRRALFTYKLSPDSASGFIVVVLVFAALNGLMESAFVSPGHPSFVIMVALASLGFSVRHQKKQGRYGHGGTGSYKRYCLHI